MKILCVSDYVDPLIYNQEVKKTFGDVDLVLCAGDLPLDYVDFIVTVLSKPTYFVFGNHNLKDYSLYHKSARYNPGQENGYSNHEIRGHGAIYAGFKSIVDHNLTFTDPKTGKRTPLLIAGTSGSFRYNKGMSQYTEFQMKMKLIKMIPKLLINKMKYGRYLDIFLTHATPRHVHDHEDMCHRGFECFNWFLEKFKPAYMIHGHIHLYDMREIRVSKYDETTVVNAYAHCIVNFPEENTEQNNI